MSLRGLNGGACLLRISIRGSDTYRRQALYLFLIEKARRAKLAGCTVFRNPRNARGDLGPKDKTEPPTSDRVLIELIDVQAHLRSFLSSVDSQLRDVAASVEWEDAFVRCYQDAWQREFRPIPANSFIHVEGGACTPSALLKIFIGDSDQYRSKPLADALLARFQKRRIAESGKIVGLMGYGANSLIHTNHFWLSTDLPIILYARDDFGKIDALAGAVQPMLKGALIIEQDFPIQASRTPGPS